MEAAAKPRCGRDQVEERDAPTQDRDDGERDREVGEAAHRAEEFLRVAQAVQALHILRDQFFFGLFFRYSHYDTS